MTHDGKTGPGHESAQAAIEGRKPEAAPSRPPPAAGPHDDPSLVNPDATPGAGSLNPPGRPDDADASTG